MRKKQAGTIDQARTLRGAMDLPEVLLWRALRTKPEGLKFRRQHPIGRFVLDFFCREAGLAIEVDGEAHDRAGRPARDEARDAAFRSEGITTLCIPAKEVLGNLDAVVGLVVADAASREPLHHPATPDGPPPREKLGED